MSELSTGSEPRRITVIRWVLVLVGSVAIAIDIFQRQLSPPYAALAPLGMPLFWTTSGLIWLVAPLPQEIWSRRTLRILGMLMLLTGIASLIVELTRLV